MEVNICLHFPLVEYDIDEDIPFKIAPEWESRLNFSWPDGNFTMNSLELHDEGRFQCQARINNMWGIEAFADIIVYGMNMLPL